MASFLNGVILDIEAIDFDISGKAIFIPNVRSSQKLSHKVSIEYVAGSTASPEISLESVEVFLVNSSNGNKYQQIDASVRIDGESILEVSFKTDWQSGEYARVDRLEILLKYNGRYETYFTTDINIKLIQTTTSVFEYKTGNAYILDSNMMANRTKSAFATWSTNHKNILSNSIKLMEPLHSTFNSSYNKFNEYLKQSYDLDYTPLKYSRIFLDKRPMVITRETTPREELRETLDIFSSIKKLEVNPISSEEAVKLFRVILEPNDVESTDEYSYLNDNLSEHMYIKRLPNQVDQFLDCIIYGLDREGNQAIESLLLRSDLYTKLQTKFSKIVRVSHGTTFIEITNYVDLRYNHYVINRPYIYPPIVDRDFRAFKPTPSIKSNNSLDSSILVLDNNSAPNGQEQYKYSLEHDHNSLYVTDELDVVYCDRGSLMVSKLNTDFTKNTTKDPSTNNNEFISVSDINTAINDWVDVVVKSDLWFDATENKALLIQVRNDSDILYYNYETNELSSDKVFVYRELMNSDIIEFSVFVDNDQPFTFTLYNERQDLSVVAMSCIDVLMSYDSRSILEYENGDHLILYNNELCLASSGINEATSYLSEDFLYITFKWESHSTLNWKINVEDSYISENDSTLNPDFFNIDVNNNRFGGPVVVRLDIKRIIEAYRIDSLGFTVTTAFDNTCGYITGRAYSAFEVSYKGTTTVSELNSKRHIEPIGFEYSCQVELEGNVYIIRNDDYDL